ncbi:MAG: thioredoxin-disulfide reductase [Syntrophorhabdaceae bacterium]|nr:thioredoxin-disulfide reductase [Syntrophorhabdaceae bacterium]MDD4196015.1 thioredoxin-disulfide reductase [Syntrophorhabdaceae bacterium]
MAEQYEAIIVGAGPAGLTAGLYLMRAGIGTLLCEKLLPGGTPLNTERIENYPGFPEGISGRELMERFAAQAEAFGLPIREFSEVQSVEHAEGRFIVRINNGEITADGLIVATGSEPVKMGIPGEDELTGRGVSYCATCDGMFFRDLEVAVIGGGDSAIEEALSLANIVKKVYVVHRRDSLRAQKILQERAFKNPRVEFLWNSRPVEIVGTAQVEGLIVEDTGTGQLSEVAVSGVFFYVGFQPNTNFIAEYVERDPPGYIITDDRCATRTPGLYAAGDVRKKSLRQISTAVGDGAVAAVSLERYILEKKG